MPPCPPPSDRAGPPHYASEQRADSMQTADKVTSHLMENKPHNGAYPAALVRSGSFPAMGPQAALCGLLNLSSGALGNDACAGNFDGRPG